MLPQNQLTAFIVALVIGVIGGYFIAQRSAKREKIYGGVIPKAFNYIASAAMIALAPSVLCSTIVLGNELGFTLILLATLLLTAIGSSMIFALFENSSRKAALSSKTDRGWTEEDARKSGL